MVSEPEGDEEKKEKKNSLLGPGSGLLPAGNLFLSCHFCIPNKTTNTVTSSIGRNPDMSLCVCVCVVTVFLTVSRPALSEWTLGERSGFAAGRRCEDTEARSRRANSKKDAVSEPEVSALGQGERNRGKRGVKGEWGCEKGP